MTSAEITGRLEALGPTIRARRGEIERAAAAAGSCRRCASHTGVRDVGAANWLVATAQTQVPTLSQAVLADRPIAQIELARAETALAAARALLCTSVDDLWRTLNADASLTPGQLAFNRLAALNATETGASATRAAAALPGGSAIDTSASMQRDVRDAEAVTHHFTVAPHVWEDAGGRLLMGSPADRADRLAGVMAMPKVQMSQPPMPESAHNRALQLSSRTHEWLT